MGRIKSKLVKKTAKNLLNIENKFTKSFNENKKILFGLIPNKKTRNQIAGYIARLKKKQ